MSKTFTVAAALLGLVACSPTAQGALSPGALAMKSECDVADLRQLYASPTSHFGKQFCGEAFAIMRGWEIFLVPDPRFEISYDEVVILLDRKSNDRLRGIKGYKNSVKVRLTGKFDGVRACFSREAIEDEESSCVPYRFPTTISVSAIGIVD